MISACVSGRRNLSSMLAGIVAFTAGPALGAATGGTTVELGAAEADGSAAFCGVFPLQPLAMTTASTSNTMLNLFISQKLQ